MSLLFDRDGYNPKHNVFLSYYYADKFRKSLPYYAVIRSVGSYFAVFRVDSFRVEKEGS